MAYPASVLEVFIASPSDVPEERKTVREIVAEWNAVHSRERGVVLLPVGWETHSSPELGEHPQELVNQRILAFADILVGVFSTRIGTATKKAPSGTIEEIEEHVAAGKPAMLYFSTAPVPRDADRAQLEEVEKFKTSALTRGLVSNYATLDDFAASLRKHLPIMLRDNQYVRRLLGAGPAGPPVVAAVHATPITLSDRAEKLLQAAVGGSGDIMVLEYLGGASVRAGSEEFSTETQSEFAKLKSAVNELERYGFVEDPTGKREFFSVTGDGYEAVEKS